MTSNEHEDLIAMLRRSLEQNVGNRLTPELATGIMNTFHQASATLIVEPEEKWGD